MMGIEKDKVSLNIIRQVPTSHFLRRLCNTVVMHSPWRQLVGKKVGQLEMDQSSDELNIPVWFVEPGSGATQALSLTT